MLAINRNQFPREREKRHGKLFRLKTKYESKMLIALF